MQIRRYFVLVAAMITLPLSAVAQDSPKTVEKEEIKVNKATKKADEYFDHKEYTVAIEAYAKAYSKEKQREEKRRISYNVAECYRYTGQFKRAAGNYLKAKKLGYGPEATLGYAEMLQSQGEYEDALDAYTEYKKLVPNDPRADMGINSCRQSKEWIDKGSLYSVDNAKDLNSKQSDYAISYAGKRGKEDLTLMISSMREDATGKKEDGWMGQRFSDIYVVEGQKKKGKGKKGAKDAGGSDIIWGDLESIGEVINTKDHEGVLTFDSRGKTLYFTKCIKLKNTQMGCAIYSTKKVGQDWANPEPVVIAVDSNASVGHPSLSKDDKILYFAGELTQGVGGKDIFMTTYDRRKREWKAPVALSINTGRDELYPYVHGDGYLYFSSNGMPGMGGFDCYRVKLDDQGMPIGDVENMLSPINSEGDDIALRWIPGDNTLKGFVVSNRKGTRGEHDIWSVTEWKKDFIIEGRVTSTKDGKPVDHVNIEVTDKEGYSFTVSTDDDGHYIVEEGHIVEDHAYKLNLSREKFLNAIGDASTENLSLSDYTKFEKERKYVKTITVNLVMDPIEVPIVLPDVFFDLASAELRPESKVALDSVYGILIHNPNITISLRSHTDYRDSDEKNQILSQARAQSCVDYLIQKGILAERLTAVGMGESEHFTIPKDYKGYGSKSFKVGDYLSEEFIKGLPSDSLQEVANQINRRTDFKVLRDDYVPPAPVVEAGSSETGAVAAGTAKPQGKQIGQTMTLGPRDRSLGKIAIDNGMNVVQLKALNGGLRGARPMAGMVLKITFNGDYKEFDANHYQVQRGDVLRSIAKKTGTDVKTLRGLNGIKSDKELIIGSWIQTK